MAITYDATVTESWVTYEFIWHTAMDDRVCPFCMRLEGQIWTTDKLVGILEHPDFGPVWDLDSDVSLAHGGAPARNCRCFLEVRPIVELEKSEIFQSLNMMFQQVGMNMPSNIDEANAQVDKLRANFGMARGEFREMEYILYRTTGMLGRLGLPPEIDQGVQKIQRMIMMVRMLHSAMMYFEAGTPLGWILAIIAGFSLAASASDFALSLGE